MDVILHNDDVLAGFDEAQAYTERELERALKGLAKGVTRVEVWVADENAQKGGPDDKRCTMEAHPQKLKPVGVTHHAPTIREAITGAARKLAKVLEREFHKDEVWRRKNRRLEP